MKRFKYYIWFAACIMALTSCMDGENLKGEWNEPDIASEPPFGNSEIEETNVITIKKLLESHKSAINTEGDYDFISEDIQIKGYVTCNDRTGNMYKEIMIQDETAAISFGIGYSGLSGFLPEGQEIIVNLKGLYIGNYRLAAVIGIPYTDSDGTYCVGQMPLTTWNKHFNFTANKKSKEEIEAMIEVFADGTTKTKWKIDSDAGKLGILKNVSIKSGGFYDPNTDSYIDGIIFIPGESALTYPGYSTSWYFNEQPDGSSGGVQIYTSSYADYASNILPTGKMNIKGIIKRYRNQWEIIIRDLNDIEIIQ